MKFLILVSLLVLGTYAEENEKQDEQNYVQDAVNFLDTCGAKDYSLCFKERALHYVESLPSDIVIGGGLSIKANENKISRAAREYKEIDLPEEPRAREDAIEHVLLDKIVSYFSTHDFEFKMPDGAINEVQRSLEEGRKKSKKSIMPLLILLKLKLAMFGAIALKTLAIISFKALVIAKVALTISLIIALKKLTDSGHQHASYEVVASHDDHHRSFKPELPYRGYAEKFEEPIVS